MKLLFLAISVMVIQCCADLASAGTINLSNSKISIVGKAQMKFDSPGGMWAGLSPVRRFPIIYSGDLIALRLATTTGQSKWLKCDTSTACTVSTCPAGDFMTAAKWSSCSAEVFMIRAFGKADGQPVDSGDHVKITFPLVADTSLLYCTTGTNDKCTAAGGCDITKWHGNHWLSATQCTFRIFSKDGVDGTPVQLGDIVGFKYPYQSNSAWLYYDNNHLYARSCHTHDKASCAKQDAPTGFQIFKKL